MIKNYVVADSLVHAKAMIRWLRLDEDRWSPLVYGSAVTGKKILDVMFVPPAREATDAHATWIREVVLTRVVGHILDIGMQRLRVRDLIEDDGPALAQASWEEQTLF